MKLIYKTQKKYLIKLDDDKYCYTDGDFIEYGTTPVKFLRFNPYMEYVEDKKIEIPKEVIEKIKEEE